MWSLCSCVINIAFNELAARPSSPKAKIVFLQLAPMSISSTALSSHTAVLFPELPLYNVAKCTMIIIQESEGYILRCFFMPLVKLSVLQSLPHALYQRQAL